MEINLISAMLMKGLFFLKKNVSQVLLRRHLTKRLKLSMVLSESSGTCNQCVRSGAGMISKLKYYLI